MKLHPPKLNILHFYFQGVHSTLFLDQWGKTSTSEGPPPLTLSPIEEFDPKTKTNNAQSLGTGPSNHLSSHAVQNSARRKGT